jgi:excisionase family DNA binding protein
MEQKEEVQDFLAVIEKGRLLTVYTVASRLKVSPSTIYRLIDEGKLKAIRLSPRNLRVSEQSLKAYIEKINSEMA